MRITHHLRLSPYIHSNLLKFRPDSLLQSIQFQNTIQVECVSPDLSSMITYSNYKEARESNASQLQCKCYLCTAEECQLNQCKECKRAICLSCSRLCLKCNLVYCRAEVKYNYELEGEICSNCEAQG